MPKLSKKIQPDSLQGYGARLRAARKSKGWTLAQLTEASGVDSSVVSRAENARRVITPMSLSDAVRCVEALGIRLDWLARGEGPMRGDYVTVLIEDNGTDGPRLQSQVLSELASRRVAAHADGRRARNK